MINDNKMIPLKFSCNMAGWVTSQKGFRSPLNTSTAFHRCLILQHHDLTRSWGCNM
ncbi:hypothetical protein HanPSC8_Chr15g0675941 [Helianthus annuus]|nr:hypothetical protein HanPSC8_Chr15g0675941 [Helianthus annuus]